MSCTNYDKNKDRANFLRNNHDDLNLRATRKSLRWGKTYECYCRCCENVYFEYINNIVRRGYNCKCGSCRLAIYDTAANNNLPNI